MLEFCQICGDLCEGDICNDCTYRMTSHDNSDIRDRVAKHDNSAYEIDQLKIDICEYFKIDKWQDSGRKEPDVTARCLFYYILHTRFKMRPVDICKKYPVKHCMIHYHCKRFDRKFKSNIALNKFYDILRY